MPITRRGRHPQPLWRLCIPASPAVNIVTLISISPSQTTHSVFHIRIPNAFHHMKSTAHSASLWVVVERTLLWKDYGNSCQLPLTPFCEWPSALQPHFLRKRHPPALLSGLSFLIPYSVEHHPLFLYSLFFISDLICGLEFCSRFSFLETNLSLTFFCYVFISLFPLRFLRKITQPHYPLSFHWNEHSTSCIMEELISRSLQVSSLTVFPLSLSAAPGTWTLQNASFLHDQKSEVEFWNRISVSISAS